MPSKKSVSSAFERLRKKKAEEKKTEQRQQELEKLKEALGVKEETAKSKDKVEEIPREHISRGRDRRPTRNKNPNFRDRRG